MAFSGYLLLQVGEPWVQGLVEGEYADLSVEERLNALVALVTVVNEGNAIRIALEVNPESQHVLYYFRRLCSMSVIYAK